MADSRPPGDPGVTGGSLFRVNRGELLGMLPRGTAERGYRLYQERQVVRIVWNGDRIEAELSQPSCTVHVPEHAEGQSLIASCTQCGDDTACPHAAAALLQWFDIRPTMHRLGPGAAWRAKSRHPFIAPSRTAAERVDLSHLTGSDLRSALELQLSLQSSGTATARLVGNTVEIHITLPSGDTRVVFFSAPVLPVALPLLRTIPRIRLEGDLEGLELSEARLHPVLTSSWNDEGIVLEPGYRLADGTVLPAQGMDGRIHGRWARIGNLLCRVLDPATPLVPFHRKGRQTLTGEEALRFLNLDHPQLTQHPWYLPQGHLASFRTPLVPTPVSLEANETPNGKILVRATFQIEQHELTWTDALDLLEVGYERIGESIVRAPDMRPFERAGFRFPRHRVERGLLGTRIAFIRLVAASGIPVVGGDESLCFLSDVLQGRQLPPVTEDPPGLKSRLRPYQREGVGWLWNRYLAGVGALLADDMGLGKTHQVMGLLCFSRARAPKENVLVVCPRGVLEHWHDLLSTYAPEIPVVIFHGPTRSLDDLGEQGTLVLTTYDLLLRTTEELAKRSWDVAVFDEAQRIKNPRTKAARAARKVPAAFRVALTGTPLENRLLELWSVVDLILPGFLGSEREFRSIYRNPTHHQLHRLRQRLSVLTLRRVKEQVLSDLPEKVEDIRFCTMLPDQEELYRSIHEQQASVIAEALRDSSAEIPYMHIFALLTKLKQVCDHPALVKGESIPAADSAKLEVFEQILDEALAGEHQVVVFSQYVKMIDLLSRYLSRRDIEHLTLVGSTRDRSRIVRRFNSEQHERVLLASLLAGGIGIDLTGASVVIHYDRWWNPARENQATDRVHRIGQRRFVQVFKLITRDTIEERIDALIRSKLELIEEVVTPTEEVVGTLSRNELAALLDLDLDG
jgi:superfamily II DNA or RNA helicase